MSAVSRLQNAKISITETSQPIAPQKTLRAQLVERMTNFSSFIFNAANSGISTGAFLANRVTRSIQSHPFASLSLLAGMIGSVIGARYFLSNSPIILPTCPVDTCPIHPQCIPTDLTCEDNLQPLLPSTQPRQLPAYPKSDGAETPPSVEESEKELPLQDRSRSFQTGIKVAGALYLLIPIIEITAKLAKSLMTEGREFAHQHLGLDLPPEDIPLQNDIPI